MKNPYYPISIETSDGTDLFCPSAKHSFNADTYSRFKKIFCISNVLLGLLCILLTVFAEQLVQTIAAILLGGILSGFVWMLSVWQNDKINAEISNIDACIGAIDFLIREMRDKIYYYEEGLDLKQFNPNHLGIRLTHLVRCYLDLNSCPYIDSTNMRVLWIDGSKPTISDFYKKYEEIIKRQWANNETNAIVSIINHNEHDYESRLLGLRFTLLKQKTYITCGNAPVSQEDFSKIRHKAETFDAIFNRHRLKNDKEK